MSNGACESWAGKHDSLGRPLDGRRYVYRLRWEEACGYRIPRTTRLLNVCGDVGCINPNHWRLCDRSERCVASGCDRQVEYFDQRLCGLHYNRWHRHGDVTVLNRAPSTIGMSAEARKRWVDAYKLEKGCMDCGYNEHPAALDFDHRPGTVKVRDIKSGKQFGWQALMDEIEKCDVVCANCHRIRTYDRRREVMTAC